MDSRNAQAVRERLRRAHAAVLGTLLQGSPRVWVCKEIAARLGMTLMQLQRAAADLECQGAVVLTITSRGLLVNALPRRRPRASAAVAMSKR
jgi:hypothetical protein